MAARKSACGWPEQDKYTNFTSRGLQGILQRLLANQNQASKLSVVECALYNSMAQEEPVDSASRLQYLTPPISELRNLLWTNRRHAGPVNQVWPGLYLGDEDTARDKAGLAELGITHVVNAAAGPRRINTGPQFYTDMAIQYRGVEAADHPTFDLQPFFYPTAEFIQSALSQKGKVLVHCAMGVSRSATLVLAFLMICEKLTLVEAINVVRQHRHICPNEGFLDQLRHLDTTLATQRHS